MQTTPVIESAIGDPTWEIAELFPRQGHWSDVVNTLPQASLSIGSSTRDS